MVLEAQTHHYTSTSVSGGGGHVTTIGNKVEGRINPISSTTHFHRDQEIWISNLKTGTESKLLFGEINLEVRPGHKLITLTDPETNEFERIYNLNNARIYSLGRWNSKVLPNHFVIWFLTILYSVLIPIPFIGWLFGISVIVEVCGLTNSVLKYADLRAKFIIVGLGFLDLAPLLIVVNASTAYSEFIGKLIAISLMVLFGWYYRKQMIKSTDMIRAVSKDIDAYLTEYVRGIPSQIK